MKIKNKKQILNFLLVGIILLSVSLVSAESVLQAELVVYKNEVPEFYVELNSIEARSAEYVDESINPSEYGDVFELKMFDSSNNVLHSIYFSPSFIIYTDPPVFVDESFVLLNLPYYEDADHIKVYRESVEKLNIDISELLCNHNNICEGSENYYSCPSDCEWYEEDKQCIERPDVELDWWEDYYCDVDCPNDDDCGRENCNDGVLNQDETETDCGGVCMGCPVLCKEDVNDDGRVNILDMLYIRNHLNDNCDGVEPLQGDVNEDCWINILDMIAVRNKLNQNYRECVSEGCVEDVTGDGQVNDLDLNAVRDRLGSDVTVGDNWKADVNFDGFINILDITTVSGKLNQNYEECAGIGSQPSNLLGQAIRYSIKQQWIKSILVLALIGLIIFALIKKKNTPKKSKKRTNK